MQKFGKKKMLDANIHYLHKFKNKNSRNIIQIVFEFKFEIFVRNHEIQDI